MTVKVTIVLSRMCVLFIQLLCMFRCTISVGPGTGIATGITYYKMYGVITGFRVIPLCDSGP